MPRSRALSIGESQLISEGVVANYQQAIYTHPGGYTNRTVAIADNTQRFIAVPPIQAPDGSFSQHLLYPGQPVGVEIYRDEEYYIAFNSTVASNTGAWVPGGIIKYIPLHPNLAGNTLALHATVGTSDFRVNWVQG